ncbi:MAG: hypothetical protein JWN52_2279 [Actinomycetia bacterium]|jgi:hypothetical protein|nr:hypothetical protein [Actinomycetes bacterium]
MTSPDPWQMQASFSGPGALAGPMRPTFIPKLVTWATLAGWTVVVIAEAITAQIRLGLIDSLSDPANVDLESIRTNDRITLILMILELCATLVVGIALIAWLFRVRANALAIRDDGQRWGRPWVVFGWIVPIANFWVPKQIVDDIWSTSAPAQEGRQGVRKPLLVAVWWITWWLYSFASNFIARTTGSRDDLASLRDTASNTVLIAPIGILAAVLTAAVVWRISRFQETQAARIAAALA